jgi:uncharacterized protein YndB with AHSA1/START domain
VARYETSVEIAAPPERVWEVLCDVRQWPRWTPSVSGVDLLNGEQLRVGSRALVRQPKIQDMEWTVTALEPGQSFAWRAHNPGITVVAAHLIEPAAAGSRLTLSVEQSGVCGLLLRPFIGGLTRRYMRMEAFGLKTRCESMDG